MQRCVLVTGGNRGVGLEICRQMAQQGWRVFLSARHEAKALEACKELVRDGLSAEALEMDVSSDESIALAATRLQDATPALHALINNAGIYTDGSISPLKVGIEVILEHLRTNSFGPLQVIRALLPLLEAGAPAQVVNLSSGLSQLQDMKGAALAYRMSKTSLNVVTKVMATELASRGIHVHSACPGWVNTAMGGKNAPKTPTQGADTPVWLACGGAGEASGGFYRERKPIPW